MLAVAKTWDGRPLPALEVATVVLTAADDGGVDVAINAPFYNDPTPPLPPGRTPGLWEWEVVEVFIASHGGGDCPYVEVGCGSWG